MFARSWAGLPNDAPHSTDLLELGYAVMLWINYTFTG